MHTPFDPLEIATRAALLLGAPGAAVVLGRQITGVVGLTDDEAAELQRWLDTDPNGAVPWEGRLRRLARTSWPGDEADEVWILGRDVRRLPEAAYWTLVDFMEQIREDWQEAA